MLCLEVKVKNMSFGELSVESIIQMFLNSDGAVCKGQSNFVHFIHSFFFFFNLLRGRPC